MKVVNSKAKHNSRLAKGVPIKIETWSESTNMITVLLDNFQVILIIEFMDMVKSTLMSFLNSLCLIAGDGHGSCFSRRNQ